MNITSLPADDASCGWVRLLPEPLPARRLTGAQSADWVVIGAGFTGLAAARRLAELVPGQRILLIEAQRVAEGASGRNSGFIIDQPHNVDARNIEDREANSRVKRLNLAAIEDLRRLVQDHGIDCDWSEIGKIHAAVEPVGERELEAMARGLDRLGQPYELLDRDRLAAILGSRYYSHGLTTPGCILMQPAALVRGLAAALPEAVELYEESPVLALNRAGGGWDMTLPQGSVRAGRVILATDAFTPGFGFLKGRLVPVYTYASLTRPLSMDEVGGAAEWAVLPAHKAGTTLRRLKNGRILVRNSFRYGGDYRCTPDHLARVRRRHAASFAARWPGVAAKFDWSWGGVIGFSRNFAPFFGPLGEDLYAAAGTNGVGAAKGTISGRLIAELALGHASSLLDDMRAFPAPSWNPPDPFLGPLVRARLAWEQAGAGRER